MNKTPWEDLFPLLIQATGETLYMVSFTFLLAGILGLAMGLTLNVTRPGGLLSNKVIFGILNILVNIGRPIPFIILLSVLHPLTKIVVGKTIGTEAGIFVMIFAACFAIARIVEQNLVTVDPGVIEAVRAAGAKPFRIIFTVLIPEALGPLILGFTYVVIALIDMSALVGAIGGGGLGNFALVRGHYVFRWDVTIVATIVIIVLVQSLQFFGNWLSRKVMRR